MVFDIIEENQELHISVEAESNRGALKKYLDIIPKNRRYGLFLVSGPDGRETKFKIIDGMLEISTLEPL